MFRFLKDKLKGAISKASKKIEEEGQIEEREVERQPEPPEQPVEKTPEAPAEEKHAETVEEKPESAPVEAEAPKAEVSGSAPEVPRPEVEEKPEAAEQRPEAVESSEEPKPEEKKRFAFSSWFRKKREEAEESPAEEIPAQEVHSPVAPENEAQQPAADEPAVGRRTGEDAELRGEPHPQESQTVPSVEESAIEEPAEQKEERSQNQAAEREGPEEKPATPSRCEQELIPENEAREPAADNKQTLAETEGKGQGPAHLPSASQEEKPAEQPSPADQPAEQAVAAQAEEPQEEPKKRGFFGAIKERIVTTKISDKQFEDIFFELEMALLENNVAVEVIDQIKSDLHGSLVDQPIRRNKVAETVMDSLKDSIRKLFEESFDVLTKIKEKPEKPYVIAFFGINGSGKTTSIAKVTSLLKESGHSVVIAASDTFRAAAIDQLGLHAEKLGVKLIKHDYGSDPAAVAFDAIAHAKSKGVDVVLVDTAGRMHQNTNLMDEMKKIIRVAKPDLKVFVGESITGNDCVEQAQAFNDAVGIDGIILSKADIDEKGGAAVSVSYVTKRPILYLGTGQEYKDLTKFDTAVVMENLGLA